MTTWRCLSLQQPWATLVMCGAKTIETRSWAFPERYRNERLYVHASMPRSKGELIEWCASEPFNTVLRAHTQRWWAEHRAVWEHQNPIPLGALLGSCRVTDVYVFAADHMRSAWTDKKHDLPDPREMVFGDYTPGRCGFQLADVQELPVPIPAKGRLGLWPWEGADG